MGPVDVGGVAIDVSVVPSGTCALLDNGEVSPRSRASSATGETPDCWSEDFEQHPCLLDAACCVGDDEVPSARGPVVFEGP